MFAVSLCDIRAERWQLDVPAECPGVTRCRVDIPEVDLHPGPDGAVPQVSGAVRGVRAGEPDLPVLVRVLPVPEGCEATVELVSVDAVETNGVIIAPVPAQEAVEVDGQSRLRPIPGGRSGAYREDAFWPPEAVKVQMADRGTQRWARVVCYPLQYNPVTGVLRWNRSVEARLVWRRPEGRS